MIIFQQESSIIQFARAFTPTCSSLQLPSFEKEYAPDKIIRHR